MKISRFILMTALFCMILFATGCQKSSEKDIPAGETFVLKAKVISISDRLEVEVIESDYAFGVYWVLISDSTKYENSEGEAIKLSEINADDTIEIVYGGQVMMSYPPQIVAQKVILL